MSSRATGPAGGRFSERQIEYFDFRNLDLSLTNIQRFWFGFDKPAFDAEYSSLVCQMFEYSRTNQQIRIRTIRHQIFEYSGLTESEFRSLGRLSVEFAGGRRTVINGIRWNTHPTVEKSFERWWMSSFCKRFLKAAEELYTLELRWEFDNTRGKEMRRTNEMRRR